MTATSSIPTATSSLKGGTPTNDKVSIPHVPDGVLFRVLSKLMLLDGERISYRTLAVEQIGSVYEAIMGFELHVASGPSIAIKPVKRHGAPTTINLEELLRTVPDKRLKWFTDKTDQKLTGQAVDALEAPRRQRPDGRAGTEDCLSRHAGHRGQRRDDLPAVG